MLSSQELSFRYKYPSRREIHEAIQVLPKRRSDGEKKRIATDPIQLNTPKLRRATWFSPRDLITLWAGTGPSRKGWALTASSVIPSGPSGASGKKSTRNRKGKDGSRERSHPYSPMPCHLLLPKLDDSQWFRKVKAIVTREKVNPLIRFYIPKGRNHLHFTSPQGIVVLMLRGDPDLEEKLLLV